MSVERPKRANSTKRPFYNTALGQTGKARKQATIANPNFHYPCASSNSVATRAIKESTKQLERIINNWNVTLHGTDVFDTARPVGMRSDKTWADSLVSAIWGRYFTLFNEINCSPRKSDEEIKRAWVEVLNPYATNPCRVRESTDPVYRKLIDAEKHALKRYPFNAPVAERLNSMRDDMERRRVSVWMNETEYEALHGKSYKEIFEYIKEKITKSLPIVLYRSEVLKNR